MRINYRFFDNFSKKDVLELKEIGINIVEGVDAFVVYEDIEIFDKVKKRYGEKWLDHVSVTDTDFTETEKLNSSYLSIVATKMLGYPQPEDWDEDEGEKEPKYPFDIYPYFENVYEIAGTNPDYGMLRGKQIGSFSLLGEPKWGKTGIGTIFWCEDVFFTTPDIYKSIFEPFGIKSRIVLGYGNQKSLNTVVQLLPQGISESPLKICDEQIEEFSEIPEWKFKKYILNQKGFFPSFEKNPGNYDLFVSREYFGSGGVNERAVFISQRLYQLLKKHSVKGLKYYPQEIVYNQSNVINNNRWTIIE